MYKSMLINELNHPETLEILDIREVEEQVYGMIPNAKSFPLSNIQNSITKLDKGKTYYLVCESGSRSQMACEYLANLGYDVVNLLGGMSAYKGHKV